MRHGIIASLALSTFLIIPAAHAATPTIVPYANRNLVDTDGDAIADLVDNAPGTPNVAQLDLDADGIGDDIDPAPATSNPFIGDPGLGMGGPYTITPSSHAFIGYLMLIAPPGSWGHIDLDLGGDGIFDATYFGPLTTSLNQIDIPPSLFVSPLWNLNTPGSYTLHAKAFGPAMPSQFDTITSVIVAPEPASISLAALASIATLSRRRVRTT